MTTRRRVLVLGATGHLGALVCDACAARGLEVVGASRGGERGLAVDLATADPAALVEGFDVVVDAVDTARVSPLPFASACLASGAVYLETSADPAVFEALLTLDGAGARGAVVLGAGVFPGLSTHLLELGRGGESLSLRARWSVFSGAGPGTVEIMLDALSKSVVSWVEGRRVERPPMDDIRTVTLDGRSQTGFALSMPDVVLAARVVGARTADFHAVMQPAVPRPVLAIVAWWAARGVFARPWVRSISRAALRLSRSVLLRHVGTRIRLELYEGTRRIASLQTSDAFPAGAEAVAVLAERWPTDVRGLVPPWEGVPLAQLGPALSGRVRFDVDP